MHGVYLLDFEMLIFHPMLELTYLDLCGDVMTRLFIYEMYEVPL